ncbi:hypothetical protein MN608_01513 [Microdochium nivale]|nr:hypothetical protein MN608_01513 [Microdochium nivale]
MAIIDGVPGLEVTVEVGGQTTTEYEDHHSSDNALSSKSVTRYIACKDDTEFSVTFRITPTYIWKPSNHSLEVKLWVDNTYAIGAVISKHHQRFITFSGVDRMVSGTNQWVRRKFKFSALKITDHPVTSRTELEKSRLGKLGTISVTVTRCIAGKEISIKNKAVLHATSSLELSEKAVKGSTLTHGMM